MPQGRFNEPKASYCLYCRAAFTKTGFNQKYCSRPCLRAVPTASGSTARQYERISGNWEKYFGRLCARSFKREGLTPAALISLLEKQAGRCKLTGVELTCVLQKSVISKTNASIDRVDPKGAYSLDNIQLVCAVVNKFRIDTPLNEFIDWCRKVADHAICE